MTERICVCCGLTGALLCCERCRAFYCSERCQISDWPSHKLYCIPLPRLLSIDDMDSTLSKSSTSSRLDRSAMMSSRKTIFNSNRHVMLFKSPLRTSCIQHACNKPDPNSIDAKNCIQSIPAHATSQNAHITVQTKNDVTLVQQNDELTMKPKPNANIQLNQSLPSDKPWQKLFPFRGNEFVKVLVQYVNKKDPNFIWVMQASLEGKLQKLLKEINKAIKPEIRHCTEREIQFGELIAAPFEGLYYRAIIIEEVNQLGNVRVRLVDYGNDYYISVNELKPATTIMKNLNAYAFCIRFRNYKHKIGDSLEIRIICKDVEIFLSEVNEKPEKIDIDIKSLPSEVKEVDTDINYLPTEVEGVDTDMKSLPSNVHKVDTDMKSLTKTLEKVDNDMKSLPSNVHKVDTDMKSLTKTFEEVGINVKSSPKKVQAIDTQVLPRKDKDIDTNSLPIKCVLKGLYGYTKIKFANIVTSTKAVAYISDDITTGEFIKMNTSLHTMDEVDKNVFSVSNIGDFVAGKTSCGWKRGVILAVNKNENKYVMFLCDTGEITLISQFKIIPTEYRLIPNQSVVLDLQKILIPETIFRTEFLVTNPYLYIKIEKELDNNKFLATLYDENNKPLADVISYSWNGTLSELNIKFWSSPFLNNENVNVGSVNDSKIYICPVDKLDFYINTFHDIGINAPVIKRCDVKINEIVLALNYGSFVRCLIINKHRENASYLIDLDSGRKFICPNVKLKVANDFIKLCPAYVLPLSFRFINRTKGTIPRETLKTMFYRRLFCVKFSGSYKNSIELIPVSGSKDLLNDIIFQISFERNSENNQHIKEEQVQSLTNIQTPQVLEEDLIVTETTQNFVVKQINPVEEIFFSSKDIELIPINTGQKVNIYCLDDSLIEEGIINACNADDLRYITELEFEYAESIEKYCNSPDIKKFYKPKINEICFSIYKADGSWYRAMCIEELLDDNYVVTFLDYGNKESVTSKDIRKFSKDFLHPCTANLCKIYGLSDPPSNEILKKMKSIFRPNKIIMVDEITFKNNTYVLRIERLFE